MAKARTKKAKNAKKATAVDCFGDPLPEGAHVRLGTLRFRLERDDYPDRFAVSRDGAFATARVDSLKFRVWDLRTGNALHTLKCKPGARSNDRIDNIVFSPDSSLVAAYVDGHIQVFDVASGEERHEVRGLLEDTFDFTRDGRGLLVPGHKYQATFVRRLDLATGSLVAEAALDTSRVRQLALSGDGRRVMLLFDDHVAIHDADTLVRKREVKIQLAGSSMVKALVEMSEDEVLLIRHSAEESTYLDLESGASRPFVWRGPGPVHALTVSNDGRLAYVYRGDNQPVRELIDLRTRDLIGSLPTSVARGSQVAFAESLVVVLERGVIRRFDLPSMREIVIEGGGHTTRIDAVRFDGVNVITYADDATRTWSAGTGEQLASGVPSRPPVSIPAHGVSVLRAPHPDWHVVRVSRGATQLFEYKARDSVKGIAVSPTHAEVAMVDWNGYLTVLDGETGKLRWDYRAPIPGKMINPLTQVEYSPDGSRIAAGGHGKFVSLFDARTGARTNLAGHTANIERVAFSPNGKLLFTRDSRATRIWNAETGEALGTLKQLWPDAWSTDGSVAATIEYTSVVLWTAEAVLPAEAFALIR